MASDGYSRKVFAWFPVPVRRGWVWLRKVKVTTIENPMGWGYFTEYERLKPNDK